MRVTGFLLVFIVVSTIFLGSAVCSDARDEALPSHGYVGLRPLPRSQAEAIAVAGPGAKDLPLFDEKLKGQYPVVAEHLDVLKGRFKGDEFRTRLTFFEYYWGLDAKRDSLVPKESPLIQTIQSLENSGQTVEHILICREHELYKDNPKFPNAKPGPFSEDTRILFAKDVDQIRTLFKEAHKKGFLKQDNYKLVQMVQDPSFFATDERAHPIIKKLDGICFESHQFNVHWPLAKGRSKPRPIVQGAKWTLEQGKEYILYYGPIIWKSKDYVPFVERKWLKIFWKAGLPKRHPRMHYYLNLFPHAHGCGRPVGPESHPHSTLGFTKWLIEEIKMLPDGIAANKSIDSDKK